MKNFIPLFVVFFLFTACRKVGTGNSSPTMPSSDYPYSRFEEDSYYWVPPHKKPELEKITPKVHLVRLEAGDGNYEVSYSAAANSFKSATYTQNVHSQQGSLVLEISLDEILYTNKEDYFAGSEKLRFFFYVRHKRTEKIQYIEIPLLVYNTKQLQPKVTDVVLGLTRFHNKNNLLGITFDCRNFSYQEKLIHVQINSAESFPVYFQVDTKKKHCYTSVSLENPSLLNNDFRLVIWQDFSPNPSLRWLLQTWKGGKHDWLMHEHCLMRDELLQSHNLFRRFDKVIKDAQNQVIAMHMLDTQNPIPWNVSDKDFEAKTLEGDNLWECFNQTKQLTLRIEIQSNRPRYLPYTMAALTQLNALEIHGFYELQQWPTFLSSFPLEKLVLVSSFQKGIPKDIAQLQQLKKLKFTGSTVENLPLEIFELTQLKELDVSDNIYLKNLPPAIGKLQQLEGLSIKHNYIAELPDEFYQLSALQCLNVYGNASSFLLQPTWQNSLLKIKQAYPFVKENCDNDYPNYSDTPEECRNLPSCFN